MVNVHLVARMHKRMRIEIAAQRAAQQAGYYVYVYTIRIPYPYTVPAVRVCGLRYYRVSMELELASASGSL